MAVLECKKYNLQLQLPSIVRNCAVRTIGDAALAMAALLLELHGCCVKRNALEAQQAQAVRFRPGD